MANLLKVPSLYPSRTGPMYVAASSPHTPPSEVGSTVTSLISTSKIQCILKVKGGLVCVFVNWA